MAFNENGELRDSINRLIDSWLGPTWMKKPPVPINAAKIPESSSQATAPQDKELDFRDTANKLIDSLLGPTWMKKPPVPNNSAKMPGTPSQVTAPQRPETISQKQAPAPQTLESDFLWLLRQRTAPQNQRPAPQRQRMDYTDNPQNRQRFDDFVLQMADLQRQTEAQRYLKEDARIKAIVDYIQNYRIPARLLTLSQQRFDDMCSLVLCLSHSTGSYARSHIAFELVDAVSVVPNPASGDGLYVDPVDRYRIPILRSNPYREVVSVHLGDSKGHEYFLQNHPAPQIPLITHMSGAYIHDPNFFNLFDQRLFSMANSLRDSGNLPRQRLQAAREAQRLKEEESRRIAALKIDTRSDWQKSWQGPPARFFDGTILRKPDGSIVPHSERHKYYDGTAGFLNEPKLT